MQILEARKIKEEIKNRLIDLKSSIDDELGLSIIQVGDNSDSNAYINHKIKFGESLGVKVSHFKFEERVSEEEIIEKINELNKDEKVHGIIVQLPIPEHLDKRRIIESIDSSKDIDGLTSVNVAKLVNRGNGIVPATARGVMTLIDYYNIELEGKRAVIVGRSELAGMPIALSLLSRNATVTIAHSYTENLSEVTKTADILVVAAGAKHLITLDYIKEGAVIIDVGIHTLTNPKGELEIEGKKYTGDVDFDSVSKIAKAISPVPGGIGQLTVACLYENLFDAYKKSR